MGGPRYGQLRGHAADSGEAAGGAGAYDRGTVHGILDQALICHVCFVVDGHPRVIPTTHWRLDETLYLHGSAASRMLRELTEGIALSVAVTLLDGLVLARSAFHGSINYRSVGSMASAARLPTPPSVWRR